MSNLVKHAQRELEIWTNQAEAELDDYDKLAREEVMGLVERFAQGRHSGFSARYTLAVFTQLVRFENLTPLTDDPKEWVDHSSNEVGPMYQSSRCFDAFSHDGGKTYYRLEERRRGYSILQRIARWFSIGNPYFTHTKFVSKKSGK